MVKKDFWEIVIDEVSEVIYVDNEARKEMRKALMKRFEGVKPLDVLNAVSEAEDET